MSGLLCQHDGLFFGRGYNKIWKMLWFGIIWSLWTHRNEIIFKDGKLDLHKVLELIKIRVWLWCKSLLGNECFSFLDWCLHPLYCLETIL